MCTYRFLGHLYVMLKQCSSDVVYGQEHSVLLFLFIDNIFSRSSENMNACSNSAHLPNAQQQDLSS